MTDLARRKVRSAIGSVILVLSLKLQLCDDILIGPCFHGDERKKRSIGALEIIFESVVEVNGVEVGQSTLLDGQRK